MATDVDKIVKAVDSLPALPDTAIQLLRVARDNTYSVSQIVKIVERDPSVATQIMKVANSPFYGFLGQVSSLEHATALLGVGELKNIVMASALSNFYTAADRESYAFMRRLRDHSVQTALVARMMVGEFNQPEVSEMFLMGLIHDIGYVVLAKYLTDDFAEAVAGAEHDDGDVMTLEKEVFGASHCEVGALMLEKWRLPMTVVYPVLFHHSPWLDDHYPLYSTILHFSDVMARIASDKKMMFEGECGLETFLGSRGARMVARAGLPLSMDKLQKLQQRIEQNLDLSEDALAAF